MTGNSNGPDTSRAVTTNHLSPSVPQSGRDLLPWYDQVDWMSSPALAYLKGLQDGAELGREEHERALVRVLTEALGGPDCTDRGEAVSIHQRSLDARKRRRAFDLGEAA